jgi:hypothetical protein
MDQYMITTTDNPFSPVTQYDEWDVWDRAHGYCSNALLARVVHTSTELSDADQAQAIQDAIDDIVTENLSGVHTKAKADVLSAQSY